MMEKMICVMKDSTVQFPRLLLLHYKKLSLTEKDLLIIIYLLNQKDCAFNPKRISDDMNITLPEVLECIDHLSTSGMLSIQLKKVDGVREEQIDLGGLYEKLAYLILNEKEPSEMKTKTIYDMFEQEFGRTLSPMEYEIIGGWKDAGFEQDVISLALKEAIYNGVSNLRYIDKILYEWKKKGIHTKEDVEKDRISYQNKRVEKKELFDYDWLNDTDE